MRRMPGPPSRSCVNKKNLIFSLLIAASFVLAALPFVVADMSNDAKNIDATPLGAMPPINPSSTSTWDFIYVDANGSGTYGGGTWSWVQSTKTLTLNGINHSTTASRALDLPAGSTIMLNGTNMMTSTNTTSSDSSGIRCQGALIFDSTSAGTVTAVVDGGGTSTSISHGIWATGDISIGGNATVTATGGTATGNESAYSRGISAQDIFIGGNATVNATGGTATATSDGIIGYGGNVTIGGNATVNATGGTYGSSYSNLVISGNASVTATGNTRALNKDYIVPFGYTYFVNTATAPSGASNTGNGSSTVIGSTHKYAKIQSLPRPPTVLSVTPSGSNTAQSGNVVIVFGEEMNTTPGTVRLNSMAPLSGGTWSSGNTVFTIPYSGLANSTLYTVNISDFKNAIDIGMIDDSTHSFTTAAGPVTNVTFTAVQTGGASGTSNSTGIVITFSSSVTGLSASNITIANGTGTVAKGALTGSGTAWTIALTDVSAEGEVTVSVANFGAFNVITSSQTVEVYKGTGTGPPSGGDGGGTNMVIIAVIAVAAVAAIGAAVWYFKIRKP